MKANYMVLILPLQNPTQNKLCGFHSWCYQNRSELTLPSGHNHADSAGNPQGWRIHVGGESTETRIHVEIEGNFPC